MILDERQFFLHRCSEHLRWPRSNTQQRMGGITFGYLTIGCHAAMGDDALDVNKMNVRPGGKQNYARHDVEWKLSYTGRWCLRNVGYPQWESQVIGCVKH